MLAALDLSGLASKRWFRHKLTAGDELSAWVEDWAELPCPGAGQPVVATVVRTGIGYSYFMPVGARPVSHARGERAPDTLGDVAPGLELYDAAESADYVRAVMSLIDAGADVPCRAGLLRFRPAPCAREWAVRSQGGGYSNSVVLAERRVVLKTYRGLAGGINPEAEIGEALATVADSAGVAPFLGHVVYERPDGSMESMALATREVAAAGDAWELTLAALAAGAHSEPMAMGKAEAMEDLGRSIARLHSALAAVERPGFGRRAVGRGDLTAWVHAYHRQVDAASRALEAYAAKSGRRRRLPDAVLQSPLSEYMDKDVPMGQAIRCHGDLHLGQVLVGADGRFTIIDFEGEPSVSVSERRSLASPTRDVAGMIRSLSYARAMAERVTGVSHLAWEAMARESLMRGYAVGLAEGDADLLPPEPARTALLTHFAAEKAMYELVYELNNRPDWVDIPLAGLSAMGGQ